MKLTVEQYTKLLEPIHSSRVSQNPKGHSHLEQWDVRRTLIRVFGFGGFDIETIRCEQVAQLEHPTQPDGKPWGNGKPRWTVVYRAEVRLTVKTPDGEVVARFEDGATGDASNQPALGDAHDQAMKTALSQALKRCAVNLGDQFGLSLYNGGGGQRDAGGYLAPVVRRTLDGDTGRPGAGGGHDDGPVLPDPETAEHTAAPAAAA